MKKKTPPEAPPGGPDDDAGAQLRDSPFAGLASLRDALPPGPAAPEDPVPSAQKAGPARAVVRLERKGRRGKEVTAVEKLDLPAAELGAWLQKLKSSLGCGGAVEGTALLLQGDHRARLAELLPALGVRRVIQGQG